METLDRSRILQNAARLDQGWGSRIPEWTPAAREVAEHAVNGIVFFSVNGNHPIAVGRHQIDWQGSHHPDYEWTCQLNRFFFLAELAAGYRATGSADYASAARDYIDDWIQSHPVCSAWQTAGRDNSLNLGIRLGNSQWPGWLGTLPVFLGSAAFDDDFIDRLLESAECQLDFLSDRGLPGSGNWRLTSLDTLLVAGIQLEPRPLAGRLRESAVQLLQDAFRRQVLPDGVHIERNPSYHHWMAKVMERFWDMSRALPELGLQVDPSVVARMYDYSLASMAPDGGWNALHDCQSGRNPTYEKIYSMQADRAGFRKKAGLPDRLPPVSQFFPDAGQVCLRDSWEPTASYLAFDATQWGGAHCHQSRNGLVLYVAGEPILVDPGFLTYDFADPQGVHGKSTRAHNTVNLNGWNQVGTNPTGTRHLSRPGYDVVLSTYEGGYWPGRYLWNFPEGCGAGIQAAHTRIVLWVRGRFIVVVDDLVRSPAGGVDPSLEINWQFERGPVRVDESAGRVWTECVGANLLMLFPQMPDGMRLAVHAGENDPPRGWLPSEHGYVPAPQLTQELRPMSAHTAHAVTILIPLTPGQARPGVQARCATVPNAGLTPWRLTLQWDHGERDDIVWTDGLREMIGTVDDQFTTGALAHWQRNTAGQIQANAIFD